MYARNLVLICDIIFLLLYVLIFYLYFPQPYILIDPKSFFKFIFVQAGLTEFMFGHNMPAWCLKRQEENIGFPVPEVTCWFWKPNLCTL